MKTAHSRRIQLAYLIICLLGLYVILPQLHVFRHGFDHLSQVNLGFCLLALGAVGLTYLFAAGTYCFLAARPLPYGRTALVQVASMFTNRLLPAGIGGIGTNYLYLHKQRHTPAQASGVVAANNTLGFIGHSALVAITLLISRQGLEGARLPHLSQKSLLFILIVVLCLTVILVVVPKLRLVVKRGFQGFLAQLLSYRRHPGKLSLALLCSIGLTMANVFSLWFSLFALGVHLDFVVILLVFTFGIGVGTVTPTPGGLGGIEAGLAAGLIAYRIDSGPALAAVLLYRLISYWLPLLVGGGVFVVTSRHSYFS